MDEKTGRPRIYTEQEEPLQVATVRLPHWHKRRAKKWGDGNLSKGIRHAIEVADKAEREGKNE